MPLKGDLLGGKYRLVELIGEGGMGQVFRARHEEIGRDVAIKCLFRENSQNPEATARFFREARAAASIGHPSIIGIHDIGKDDEGIPYLIMDLLRGENLREWLESSAPVEVSFACYVAAQALSALAACHAKGIVHRDIKPDNIFLVDEAQALPGIKLLDFGISKVAKLDGTDEGRLTRTGAVLGTMRYMSPEQIDGKPDVDHRADLYSMAVVLYECVTGHLPFDAKGFSALIGQICLEPVTPPRERRPDLPEEVEAVILRAMSRKREDRYPSAAQMVEALLPFLDVKGSARISLPGGFLPESRDSSPGSLEPSSGARRSTPGDDGSRSSEQVDVRAPTEHRDESSAGRAESARSATFPPNDERPSMHEIEPRRSPSLVALILGVVGFMVAATVGTLVVLSSTSERTVEEGPAPAPIEPLASNVDAATTERDAAPAAQVEDTIDITLAGVPEGARVLLDGAEVAGAVLHVRRSDTAHQVSVELPGRAPWQETVTADADRTLTVELEPVTEPDAGVRTTKRRDGRSKRPPSPPADRQPDLPAFRTGFPGGSGNTGSGPEDGSR